MQALLYIDSEQNNTIMYTQYNIIHNTQYTIHNEEAPIRYLVDILGRNHIDLTAPSTSIIILTLKVPTLMLFFAQSLFSECHITGAI